MDDCGRRAPSGEGGAAAVEFAVVSALLFIVLFAIIQFGIIFAQELALSNGARQGARAAAVRGSDADAMSCDDVRDEVRQGAQTIGLGSVADPGLVTVDIARLPPGGGAVPVCDGASTSPACTGARAGDRVAVTARFTGSLIVPLTSVNDGAITVESTGSYKCEYS